MSLPNVTMRNLMEAGVHFGHRARKWNPKMSQYVFDERNGIHIIDLNQTLPLLRQALQVISDVVARGGRVLFVGTKRQARDVIAQEAQKCAQYFVNARWLGGMLTNWKTVSASIQRLRKVEKTLESEEAMHFTKKERIILSRERAKLDQNLGGIKDVGGLPDLLFVIDVNKEQLAIREARRLNIPVVAIVDTNCDPDGITYPIPGNDDSSRAVELYCDLVARAVLYGISLSQGRKGVDIGETENPDALMASSAVQQEEQIEQQQQPSSLPEQLHQ